MDKFIRILWKLDIIDFLEFIKWELEWIDLSF